MEQYLVYQYRDGSSWDLLVYPIAVIKAPSILHAQHVWDLKGDASLRVRIHKGAPARCDGADKDTLQYVYREVA